jgi:hypothetical protein
MEPTNAAEEKAKVAADPSYNPQFVYEPQDREQLQRVIDEVSRLELPVHGVGLFFFQAKSYLTARLKLRQHLSEDASWESPLYPPPPDRVVNLARRLLNTPMMSTRTVPRLFNSHDQAEFMRTRIKEYGFDDWKVVVRSNLSSNNTDAANRVVNIRDDARYTIAELKRNVVHEVDTHVLRAVNGASQPFRIFSVGAIPSYMPTEEGLAVINEERMRYIDPQRIRIFAGRAVASFRASRASFSRVYLELRDYRFSHDEAWTITKRVKRGLKDTSLRGGYIKDHMYLWGRILVEEYILGGGDLKQLYVGKVAIEHVPILEQLGLRPPRFLPKDGT